MKNSKKKKKYNIPKPTKRRLRMNIAYICSLAAVFEVIGLALVILPRSKESLTEQRELTEFPEFTAEKYFSGEYTSGISKWFSDTVPYRDDLMTWADSIQTVKGFRLTLGSGNSTSSDSSDSLSSPTSNSGSQTSDADDTSDSVSINPAESSDIPKTSEPSSFEESSSGGTIDPVDPGTADNSGTINFGKNNVVTVGIRAFELYGGSFSAGEAYAAALNKYNEALGGEVNVYSMVVPTACEFYSPPAVAEYCGSALDNINHIIENLSGVTPVDVYTPLANHAKEDIYLRTDHHWAPLGAYYAAEAFAKTAKVPFMDLSEYERRVTKDFVGTLYGYSGDIVIKNNPEDFVYYVPETLDYTTSRYVYETSGGKVSGVLTEMENCRFFYDFVDGSPNAYLTFMEGDPQIVHVETSVTNGRKLAIIKDSYGNAVPGYLFNSFEEIYVLDFRFFTHNMKDYIKENGITDLLFINNAFNAANTEVSSALETLLTQEDWGY